METNRHPLRPEAATDEPASSAKPPERGEPGADAPREQRSEAARRAPLPGEADTPPDLLDFDPVPVRERADGLTPERQRAFIEHLADTGIVAEAARLTGVTEQSVYRLRRRADARAFALAWDVALQISVRNAAARAIERALQGNVRKRYYHGELIEETRVWDDRLLMQLIDRADRLFPPSRERDSAMADFDGLLDLIEHGPPPPPPPPPEPEPVSRYTVWENDGVWYTDYPPPPGFDGVEDDNAGFGYGYRRTLSPAEQEVIDADLAAEEAVRLALGEAERDAYFGFTYIQDGDEDDEAPAR